MRKKHRNQEICETNQEIWKKNQEIWKNRNSNRKNVRNNIMRIIRKYENSDEIIPPAEMSKIYEGIVYYKEKNYTRALLKRCGQNIPQNFLISLQQFITPALDNPIPYSQMLSEEDEKLINNNYFLITPETPQENEKNIEEFDSGVNNILDRLESTHEDYESYNYRYANLNLAKAYDRVVKIGNRYEPTAKMAKECNKCAPAEKSVKNNNNPVGTQKTEKIVEEAVLPESDWEVCTFTDEEFEEFNNGHKNY